VVAAVAIGLGAAVGVADEGATVAGVAVSVDVETGAPVRVLSESTIAIAIDRQVDASGQPIGSQIVYTPGSVGAHEGSILEPGEALPALPEACVNEWRSRQRVPREQMLSRGTVS
jgi:hypothetical protein